MVTWKTREFLLGKRHEVFDAEFLGVVQALQVAEKVGDQRPVTMLLDSQAAIARLRHTQPGPGQALAICNGPKPYYLMYRYVQKNSLEKGRIDSMASDEFRACPRDQVTRGHLTSRWFCE